MITLLVSQIDNNNYITPTWWITDKKNPTSWVGNKRNDYYPMHNSLLKEYSYHHSFRVLELKEYNNHSNPFYVFNMGGFSDFKDTSIWDLVPEKDVDILVKNDIPILLWFPLEGPDQSILEDWENLLGAKNSTRLADNKLLVLTVSPLLEQDYTKPFLQKESNSSLENLNFILSINYCLTFGNFRFCDHDRSYCDNVKDISCSMTDHVLSKKNTDFLCLNHVVATRINRLLLLQSLYCAENLFDDNLISAVWGDILRKDPLLNDNKAREHLVFKEMRAILSDHDKKITQDESLHQLIAVFEEEKDPGFFKNKLEKINTSELSETSRFLYDFMINSFRKEIFSVKILDENQYEKRLNKADFQIEDNEGFNLFWNAQWYKDSWFSIITESWDYYKEQDIENKAMYFPMISEKVIKAIINHHPFVIFGSPGCNNILEQYNFKRFDQKLLELPNSFSVGNMPFIERLKIITDALQRFSVKSQKEKEELWNGVKEDIIHNYETLMNTDWIKVQHDLILKDQ